MVLGAFVGGFIAAQCGAFVGVLLGLVRDPDSCPGTPTTRLEFLHGHEPHVCDRGPSCMSIAGAAPQSTPSLQHASTQVNCNSQLSLSPPGCEGLIKHLGFSFVCVRVCVCGASPSSRIVKCFFLVHCKLPAYSDNSALCLPPDYCNKPPC